MQRPRVFIGSSTESLSLAYALQKGLEHVTEPTVWHQGIFQLSKSTIDSLIKAIDDNSFAVFVFAPDDLTQIRGESRQTVRDNVIFEFGLFIGRLGIERCFYVVPRGAEMLHLPTDLIGITPATYDANRSVKNWEAALGPAVYQIQSAIHETTSTSCVTNGKLASQSNPGTHQILDFAILTIINDPNTPMSVEEIAGRVHERVETIQKRIQVLRDSGLVTSVTVMGKSFPKPVPSPAGRALLAQCMSIIGEIAKFIT